MEIAVSAEELEEWRDVHMHIPDMPLEELPEFLAHENLLIRISARARLGELIAQKGVDRR